MGTIKSKYEIGRAVRRNLAALFNNLFQRYSDPGWELILTEPRGANNYILNRRQMAKTHGAVSRATGDHGLTYEARLVNNGAMMDIHFKVELIFHHGGRNNGVQIKATTSVPILSNVLEFAGERVYIIVWCREKGDPVQLSRDPDAFTICSGKRLEMWRLSATMPKGDTNQVRANFGGLTEPVFRLKPRPAIHITTRNNLVQKLLKEIHCKGG